MPTVILRLSLYRFSSPEKVNSIIPVDGKESFITAAQDATFRQWNVSEEELFQSEIQKSQDDIPIKVCALNTDGEFLALGLENGDIEFYRKDVILNPNHSESQEWNYLTAISAHDSEVTCLSWNKNIIASGGRDRFCHVIDVQAHLEGDQHATNPLKLHTATVTAVNWVFDQFGNARLVTGGLDKEEYKFEQNNLFTAVVILRVRAG